MKNFLRMIVIAGLFLSPQNLYAHPPKLTLSYDMGKKVLHIEVEHVTHTAKNHYIRKITVVKNEEEPQEFRYVTQQPSGFSQDVPLEAQKGDVIEVKAICSKAGFTEETLEVQ